MEEELKPVKAVRDQDGHWYIIPNSEFVTFFEMEEDGEADEWNLFFHSSWDWLMPVCRKWDTLIEGKYIRPKTKWFGAYISLCDALDNTVICYDIIPVFNQLVENIKWLNKQKWYNQNKK